MVLKKIVWMICLFTTLLLGTSLSVDADTVSTAADTTAFPTVGLFTFEFDQETYASGETVLVNVYLENASYVVDLTIGGCTGEGISLPELAAPFTVNPYLEYETTLNLTGAGIIGLQIQLLSPSRDQFQYIRKIASFSFATDDAIFDLETAFAVTNEEQIVNCGLATFFARGTTSTEGEAPESDVRWIVKDPHPSVSFGTGVSANVITLNHGDLLAQSQIPAVPKNGSLVPLGWTYLGETFDFSSYPIIQDMVLIPSYAMSERTGCSFLKLSLIGYVLFPISIGLIVRKRME